MNQNNSPMKRKEQHPRTFLVALLLLAVSLTACTGEHTNINIPAPPTPVPIQLYTGIRTRAAIDAFSGTPPICVACGTASGDYTQCWNGIATADRITLSPMRYYPADGSPLYLRGFYPPAPLSSDGTLAYTLTGEEDLMMTDELSGSQDAPFTADEGRTLMLRHLLTQLSFLLQLSVPNPDRYGIRSLHLNGLAQDVRLSLLTEELECLTPAPPVVIYSSGASGDVFPFESGVAQLPAFILVQPGADFTIDLTLAVDNDPSHDLVYTGLPIRFEDGVGGGGISYTVSVDIPDPSVPDPQAVSVTATVRSWQGGDSGSGDIM